MKMCVCMPAPIPSEMLSELIYDDTLPHCLRWKKSRRGLRNLIVQNPRIGWKGVEYKLHRVIWAIHYGDPLEKEVDHIDRNRNNNRIENLRLCTSAQNAGNRKARSQNSTGFKGVRKNGSGYRASIRGKNLGTFRTAEEAGAAYQKAAEQHWGEFSCIDTN